MPPEFTVETRAFRDGDEALLLAGLERASRRCPDAPRRDADELSWRYGAAPHGACVAFALDPDGAPLAGVAATRHRARFLDGEAFWLEVGDLFNDFDAGAGLARAQPLIEAGKAFADAHGGFAPEGHPIMYGLPDRRAHRLGLHSLGWEVLRSENELVLELARAPEVRGGGDDLEEPARFPEDAGEVFEGFAEGRQAVLVRDAAYLNWRYAERPGAPFALAVARRDGAPVGLAALRDGLLHEWCVRPGDERAVGTLLRWARERARGAGALRAVFPDSAPEWLLFQAHGFRVAGTREYVCFRSFQRPAIMSWMFHEWSYTRGDTLR